MLTADMLYLPAGAVCAGRGSWWRGYVDRQGESANLAGGHCAGLYFAHGRGTGLQGRPHRAAAANRDLSDGRARPQADRGAPDPRVGLRPTTWSLRISPIPVLKSLLNLCLMCTQLCYNTGHELLNIGPRTNCSSNVIATRRHSGVQYQCDDGGAVDSRRIGRRYGDSAVVARGVLD